MNHNHVSINISQLISDNILQHSDNITYEGLVYIHPDTMHYYQRESQIKSILSTQDGLLFVFSTPLFWFLESKGGSENINQIWSKESISEES